MAAAYFAKKVADAGVTDINVASAGMAVKRGESMPQGARDALAELGITPPRIGTLQVTLKDIKVANLIIVPSEELLKKVYDSFTSSHGKLVHLMSLTDNQRDIFEPRSTLETNRQCLAMMRPALDKLAEKLLS